MTSSQESLYGAAIRKSSWVEAGEPPKIHPDANGRKLRTLGLGDYRHFKMAIWVSPDNCAYVAGAELVARYPKLQLLFTAAVPTTVVVTTLSLVDDEGYEVMRRSLERPINCVSGDVIRMTYELEPVT